MDQVLERLFESVPKVRILRLLMQNQDCLFTFEEISRRTQARPKICKKELGKMLKIGIAKERMIRQKTEVKDKGRGKKRKKAGKNKKKIRVFFINQEFGLFRELKELITRASATSKDRLLKRIKKLGRVKLAVLAGVFLNQDNSRTDILLVGDDISRKKLENFLALTESELGKTLQYTLMEMDEFKYRLGMYDRFLRDILEYPHQKLVNKLDI